MKSHPLSIFIGASIALILYCIYAYNKPSGDFSPESRSTEHNNAKSKIYVTESELQISLQEDGPVDDFYHIFGSEKTSIDIPKNIVMERIDDGLSKLMSDKPKMLPDEEVQSIEVAYKRIIRGVIFQGVTFPEWGVDHGDYFVFSGQPNLRKELAFRYGYAVRKENGRIYRWWYSQEELDAVRSADKDGQ